MSLANITNTVKIKCPALELTKERMDFHMEWDSLGKWNVQNFSFLTEVFINSSNVGFPLKSKIEQIHFYIHFDLPSGGGGTGSMAD